VIYDLTARKSRKDYRRIGLRIISIPFFCCAHFNRRTLQKISGQGSSGFLYLIRAPGNRKRKDALAANYPHARPRAQRDTASDAVGGVLGFVPGHVYVLGGLDERRVGSALGLPKSKEHKANQFWRSRN